MANLLLDPLAIATDGTFSLTVPGGSGSGAPKEAIRLSAVPKARAVQSVKKAVRSCS